MKLSTLIIIFLSSLIAFLFFQTVDIDYDIDSTDYLTIGESIAKYQRFFPMMYFDQSPCCYHHPFLPSLLAFLYKISAGDYITYILLARVLMVMFYTLSCYIFYLCALKLFENHVKQYRNIAFLSFLFFLTNTFILRYSSQVLSEMPFIFLSLSSIYFFLCFQKNKRLKYLLTSFLFSLLAYYTRIVGVVLIATQFIILLVFYRIPLKKLVIVGSIVLTLLSIWLFRNYYACGTITGHITDYTNQSIPLYERVPVNALQYLPKFFGNFGFLRGCEEISFTCKGMSLKDNTSNLTIFISLSFFYLIGMLFSDRRWNLLRIYTLIYVSMLLPLSPNVFHNRYIVPLIPISILFLTTGAYISLKNFLQIIPKPVNKLKVFTENLTKYFNPSYLFAFIIITSFLINENKNIRNQWRDNFLYFNVSPSFAFQEPISRNFIKAAEWINKNTSKDAIIFSNNFWFYLYCKRKNYVSYELYSTHLDNYKVKKYVSHFLENIVSESRTNYLVLHPYNDGFKLLQKLYGKNLKLVHTIYKPDVFIYEITRDKSY